MNLGLSEKLQNAFPNLIKVPRPFFTLQEIPDPQWLIGFIDGEGCFIINTQNSISTVSGRVLNKVWLTFYITQHSRDTLLMESIIRYLNCGQVLKISTQSAVDFKVGRFEDITSKVIPSFFFNKKNDVSLAKRETKGFSRLSWGFCFNRK